MTKSEGKSQNISPEFVPALRFHWATNLYDGVMHYFTRDTLLRKLTIEAINPTAGDKILDFGCGTGSLTEALAKSNVPLSLTAYDIDPQVLEIAKGKIVDVVGVNQPFFKRVDLTDGSGVEVEALGSFDCIVSSLVFHHLDTDHKIAALKFARQLLAEQGKVMLVDWGPGSNLLLKAAFLLVRAFDGFAVTRDNVQGRLPAMLASQGFTVKEATPLLNTMFGTIWLYIACR